MTLRMTVCLGCGGVFAGRGSRCPSCLRKWRAIYDAHRPQHHALYRTAAWARLSAAVRAEATRCHWCAVPLAGRRVVADHVVPLADRPDLGLEPSNLVASCVGCNVRRGRNLRPAYRQVGMYEVIARETRR